MNYNHIWQHYATLYLVQATFAQPVPSRVSDPQLDEGLRPEWQLWCLQRLGPQFESCTRVAQKEKIPMVKKWSNYVKLC